MINKRLVPILLPLALFVLNEVFLFYPKLIFITLFLGAAFICFGLKLISGSLKFKAWAIFLILPLLLYLSFSLFIALLSNPLAIQMVMVLMFGMIFYYFKNLYYYLVSDDADRMAKLESFSLTAGFLVVFAIFFSINILPLFIRLDINIMLLISLPILFFLFLQPILFGRIKLKSAMPLIISGTFVAAQIFWLLSLLPLNPNVLGLLCALTYYLILIVVRLSFKESLNRRSLKWPLILVIIASLSLLLSARWL